MTENPHFEVQEIEELEKERQPITNDEIKAILIDTEERLLRPELIIGEGTHGSVFVRNQARSTSCIKLMWEPSTTIKAKNDENDRLTPYYGYLQKILSKKKKFKSRAKNSAHDEAAITNKAANIEGVHCPRVYAVIKLQREVDEWDENGTYAQENVEMLVMERVRGANIEQIIDHGESSLEFIPKFFDFRKFEASVLDQLERLHEAGIYHRDITVRNIMLDFVTGEPWIIDFGVSNDVPGDDPYTSLGATVGTDESGARNTLFKLKEYCRAHNIGNVN